MQLLWRSSKFTEEHKEVKQHQQRGDARHLLSLRGGVCSCAVRPLCDHFVFYFYHFVLCCCCAVFYYYARWTWWYIWGPLHAAE